MKNKTPMEQQYDQIKSNHPDKILLFRLGDFYELFNEDATLAASILNIAMTQRHGRTMCGFPHHALDQYAYKLVNAGYKVAICEQVEESTQAKGIVKREVVSVLTKGTWSENPLLDRSVNSYLAVVVYLAQELTILLGDLSTGEIILRSSQDQEPISFLLDELIRYTPVETIFAEDFFRDFNIEEELHIYQEVLRVLPEGSFCVSSTYEYYKTVYKDFLQNLIPSQEKALQGFFVYLEQNYISESGMKHFRMPEQFERNETLVLKEDTLTHLELLRNSRDTSTKDTLFSVLNYTKTAQGSRKLRKIIVAPSANLSEIKRQQERTEFCYNIIEKTPLVHEMLKDMSDLENLIARIATKKILPRECLFFVRTIEKLEKIKNLLQQAKPFYHYILHLSSLDTVLQEISATLSEECTNSLDKDTIKYGINKDLDDNRKILSEGKKFLLEIQARERLKTGISSLKVSYNKIYGYYIEVGKGSISKVPSDYIRKQSLVNCERYTIADLDSFETKERIAEQNIYHISRELYDILIENLGQFHQAFLAWSDFMTEFDLRITLAFVAKNNNYKKPILTEKFFWHIEGGRHPVIENFIGRSSFISNDTVFEEQSAQTLIVTGPNMAGKSTYLRQNALFAIMAQIGSYLPVNKAEIGIVDQIFTRIGSADNLVKGESTFFVEMKEAAYIIDNMTPSSLVVMDELGRGTSTFDGLSLAWAILEYINAHSQKRAKVFFSTHYHELSALADLPGVKLISMAIKEENGKPIFLRKVREGLSPKSFGIHVAKMAGIPTVILDRAQDLLNFLGQGSSLFSSNFQQNLNKKSEEDSMDLYKSIVKLLENIDLNTITPMEALISLSNIQEKLKYRENDEG